MRLNRDIPQFRLQPKEYILAATSQDRRRSKRPGQALIFSEKDLPGYKSKQFAWDEIDDEGNPGQGRSFLYEKHKREIRKKENKGRFTPYARRPIPKQTAVVGAIEREFDAVPVKNDEFFNIESRQSAVMLKPQQKAEAIWTREDPSRMQYSMLSMAERANINKVQHLIGRCNPKLTMIRHLKQENKLLKIVATHVWRNLSSLIDSLSYSGSTESGV